MSLRLASVAMPAMIAVFDDASTIRHALAFERRLATSLGAEGIIDSAHANAIASACDALVVDPEALALAAAHAGTLAIPLVERLRAAVPPDVAADVHRGATSQDVADTVLALQLREAVALLAADTDRITAALASLATRHAALPAMGRTLLQDAMPVGFGLRVAQWSAGVAEAAARLDRETADGAVLQWGGAAGARADVGDHADAVAARLASALGLPDALPWHARRGGITGIAAALGILIGALGKMARDVALMTQSAVEEASEPVDPGRGGSSAMPHKRNPTGCQVVLSAATRAPGLVAGVIGAMPQEYERGLGGWQAEAPMLADLCLLASGAAAAMATVAEGLRIDEGNIARHLAAATSDFGVEADIGDSEQLVVRLLGLGKIA